MKYVYNFKEGNKDMRNILGGKGANLAEMTNLGLPVPHGFTVSTEACMAYFSDNNDLNERIKKQILDNLKIVEKETNKKFGDLENPLLLSVRSGARISMPGMMDTVLNLGMNDEVCESFSKVTGNPRFCYDSYRRFIQMFSDVVRGLPKEDFEGLFDKIKQEKGVTSDTELTSDDLKEVVELYKTKYKVLTKEDFPQDPLTQLYEAIKAVFKSWNNSRAITYRRLNDIPSTWGTAVNVQEMVYGNKNYLSGTGVAFTRNPSTGENKVFGEYLINAQGEDVVAGIRTPKHIDTLKQIMPKVYDEFINICKKLEQHYKDMQDMEFTIEDGKLYILQTRSGKRCGTAAVNIAVSMVEEGLITEKEAIMLVEPKTLEELLHKTFKEDILKKSIKISKGLAASPGSATGKICFSANDAIDIYNKNKDDVILVRDETSPEDIEGINIAQGILTLRGGMTSHAAVVARGMGKCCICGCNDLKIDFEKKTLILKDGKTLRESDYLSLDGTTGNVYEGKIETCEATLKDSFKTFMSYVSKYCKLEVRCNADTSRDAKIALLYGATGIGLCRTEHMFFEKERIFNFRKMIIATTEKERDEALKLILPYQIDDFYHLFKEMDGKDVNIRLLDPPLHEFLPKKYEEVKDLASALKLPFEELQKRIDDLKEFNPMIGHRGIRLGITYPEVIKMQTRAIITSAIKASKEKIVVKPEIMIPLVCDINELKYVKEIITSEAKKVMQEENFNVKYKVGTMIETPRACLCTEKLAEEAEFFSFGTNDLTQMTYGFSRDDSEKFLTKYYELQLFDFDPFVKVDEVGVGSLMEKAIWNARIIKKKMPIGVCGEQAGDPKSIEFFNKIGVSYVSCSPYRVAIARLASAQAAIKAGRQ